MDKGTKNALMYTAGLAAAYLGYRYYKKKQGEAAQAPSTTSGNQPPQTGAAVTQATTKPKSKAPASPTFGGANLAYLAKIKTLQTLLKVKSTGKIDLATSKAASAYGISYTINATNIDKAIATITLAQSKTKVQQNATNVSLAKKTADAINKGGVVRFLIDVKSNALVKNKLGGFVGVGSGLSFDKGQVLGKGWVAGVRPNSPNIVITKNGQNFFEIPTNSIVII